jgi:hypothetical protein
MLGSGNFKKHGRQNIFAIFLVSELRPTADGIFALTLTAWPDL